MNDTSSRSRSGGRASRRALRTAPKLDMLAGLENKLPMCEIMSADDIERLDNASMDILENVGIQFRDPIALDDWRRAGAKIVNEVVYLDRGLIRDLVTSIPSEFTYKARDPAKNLKSEAAKPFLFQ